MRPPIYSIVNFRVQPDQVNKARVQMRRLERDARTLEGCIQYHFLQDLDDPSIFAGYGIWTNGADLDRYRGRMDDARENGNALMSMFDPETPVVIRTMDRI